MKSRSDKRRLVRLAAATAAFALVCGFARADQRMGAPEVRIEGGQIVKKNQYSTVTRRSMEVFELSRHVSYADLDLTSDAGAVELNKRVAESAQDACRKLAALDPLDSAVSMGSQQSQCVRDAVKYAKTQVNAAVKAAKAIGGNTVAAKLILR